MTDSSRTPLVVVSVGTDLHEFDRMIDWMDAWNPQFDVQVIIQRGTSKYSYAWDSRELIPHAELLDLFRAATVVISHGGPSTVMDARYCKKFPIVVARNPEFDEHVDEHQMEFAKHLDRNGVAKVIDSQDEFYAALNEGIANPSSMTIETSDGAIAGVVEFASVVDGLLGTTTPVYAEATQNDSGSAQGVDSSFGNPELNAELNAGEA